MARTALVLCRGMPAGLAALPEPCMLGLVLQTGVVSVVMTMMATLGFKSANHSRPWGLVTCTAAILVYMSQGGNVRRSGHSQLHSPPALPQFTWAHTFQETSLRLRPWLPGQSSEQGAQGCGPSSEGPWWEGWG